MSRSTSLSTGNGALRGLLLSYGLCATAAACAMIVAPEQAILVEAGAASDFVAHLNQSRAASLLGLGLVALLSVRWAPSSGVLAALALSNLLTGLALGVMQFTPAAEPWRWALVAACLGWAAGLAAFRNNRAPSSEAAVISLPIRIATWTYVWFTALEGLIFLLAPGLLAATFVKLGGEATPYLGLVRGAADIPIALAVWDGRRRLSTPGGRPLLIAALAANLILSVSGLLAQLNALATPSRWIVEFLHIFWAAAFAYQLLRKSPKP